MYANQYRPNFVDNSEVLARDVEVADLAAAMDLPWVKLWATATDYAPACEIRMAREFIMAHCGNEAYVVGYLTSTRQWCLPCGHWIKHCYSCGCENSSAVARMLLGGDLSKED